MVSAIKKAYSNDNLVIRLFNPTDKTLSGNLKIFPGILIFDFISWAPF